MKAVSIQVTPAREREPEPAPVERMRAEIRWLRERRNGELDPVGGAVRGDGPERLARARS